MTPLTILLLPLIAGLLFIRNKRVKPFVFPLQVVLSLVLALFNPDDISSVGSFNTKLLIIPLLQIVMFGMGATLILADFIEVLKKPYALLVGLASQLTLMPLVALALVSCSKLPPEIAAGVILVGCSPSGLASNVMVYISKGKVALSVTLTLIATIIAPLTTPLLMELLAGTMIEIDVLQLVGNIIKMVMIPVILGVGINSLFPNLVKKIIPGLPHLSVACILITIMVILAMGVENLKQVGSVLIVITLLHNITGYCLGYFLSKALRVSEDEARAIAFEVGMQNSGLACGLAVMLSKTATLGLAPAIFGPMMNFTGSLLAAFWQRKRV